MGEEVHSEGQEMRLCLGGTGCLVCVCIVFGSKEISSRIGMFSRGGVRTGFWLLTGFAVKPEVFFISDWSILIGVKVIDGFLSTSNGGTKK